MRKTPTRAKAQPYRPNYWLVALVALIVCGLGVLFLATIAALWSMSGALTTVAMLLAYGAVMYGLWRFGVSRL